MPNIQITDELLNAYLDDTATAAQRQAVEEWYESGDENRRRLEQYYLLHQLNRRVQVSKGVDVERSLRELQGRIRRRSLFGLRRMASRVAAAVAVLLFVAGAWKGAEHVTRGFSPAFTVQTAAGERSQVVLPDGTKVWLNSCTELTYASPWLAGERRVELSGEAYFEVTKNRPRSFVVHSEGLRTEVLGTRFNIRANQGDPTVTATLLEGSIRASSCAGRDCDRVLMKPGQELTLDLASGEMTLRNVDDDDNRIDWLNNCLRFRQQTLREIVRELERHYNVSIAIEDEELAATRFSGEFDASCSIHQILSVLQLAGRFSYRMSDSRITLSPEP